MEETLIIKHFGPIESVELKLKRFTILIGEQATGKSTVAKVLAVCRYFSYIVENEFSFDDEFEEGLSAWGLVSFINEQSHIYYECEHYSLTIKQVQFEETSRDLEGRIEYSRIINKFLPKLSIHSVQFSNLIDELEKIKPKKLFEEDDYFNNWRIPTSFFQNDVARIIDNPFYIPTERGLQSIFSLGKNSIQNISDSLFNQFAKLDQIVRFFKNDTLIEPLNIEYKNESGKGFVRKKGTEQYFSLYDGASGYQSTIPVVLSLEYYSLIRKKKKTFLIEEPELNLFPIAQNELMKYLVDRSISYNHQMLLTTHSPYILTSLNNLLYAYQVGQEHPDKINKIVDKKYWLNPAEVSGYRLLPDGSAKDILDYELKQVDTGELDDVSRELNGIWDQIADIEFSSVHER